MAVARLGLLRQRLMARFLAQQDRDLPDGSLSTARFQTNWACSGVRPRSGRSWDSRSGLRCAQFVHSFRHSLLENRVKAALLTGVREPDAGSLSRL
jgi:hypothetical protein